MLLDANRLHYKEIKLASGKAVSESYTFANETVIICEYWAPRVVSFHENCGFLWIQITFSVDLKQLSHRSVAVS